MRTIYIVDDDDPVRASLQGLLSVRQNLLIRSFRSGDAFLEQVNELDPGVLLLDFNMPGSNGLDVLRALRPCGTRFVAIMLTGQGNIDMAVQAMKAGAMDFLEKPYDPAVLLQLVEAAFLQHEQQNAAAGRAEQAAARIATLSPRERDVLKGLIEGRSNKVIAFELDLSPRTVEIYRANLMQKLEVRSLSEALKIAFAAGMFPDT
jgi:two-component system, LuxR family, response regulator FixJ